ncbi:hypothetical protein DBR32_01595 [Taibaiella sp. KBW10]|uniref:lanthionine synthetase LanC family protein n=1 Tax=Taibaiella sp. KBW10 TaxID=2153357 RepID=UPI000F5A5CCB|nr:lanthionine synthetase LanC family protein [Taibaiella sp. KBW10]RQO32329.1 hypothetical protein DBR32_01595 [Taibaiella sp. KBW10]
MEKQRIRNTLSEISKVLQSTRPQENSLFAGQLGLVLYFAYLSRNNKKVKQLCLNRWHKVLQAFNEGEPKLDGASYSLGYGGLLYVMMVLRDWEYISAADCEAADLLAGHLLQQALDMIARGLNDPLHGSFGILHTLLYFAEVTGKDRYAKKIFKEIRTRYYHHSPPLIVNRMESAEAAGNFNLSFAHGQCGMLMILIHAAKQLGYQVSTKRFVEKSIDYMLGYRKEAGYEGTLSIFPSLINSVSLEAGASGRLGWCYGDLGYLILLTVAGKYLQNQRYIDEAEALGCRLTQRIRSAETAISDPFFCHGTSGLVSVFTFLYAETGADIYKHTAFYWLEETLKQLDYIKNKESEGQQSILTGLPGIGLVLMEQSDSSLSDWRKMVLLP